MIEHRVICVRTESTAFGHSGITRLGTSDGRRWERNAVVLAINFGWARFYTEDIFGNRAYVRVVGEAQGWYGTPYLTTAADRSQANNLLSLDYCWI